MVRVAKKRCGSAMRKQRDGIAALVGSAVALVLCVLSLSLGQSQTAVGFVLALLCTDLSSFLGNPYVRVPGVALQHQPVPLLAGLVVAYACAWIGHFFIEKNVPLTFTYPLWSFQADYLMFFRWLSGNLRRDLSEAGA